MLSTDTGYREYSLDTHQLLKEVNGFVGVNSARRLADGRTLLASNQDGVTIHELSAADKELRHANFKTGQLRLIRLTRQGTFLFGTFFSDNKVVEGDLDGKIVRTFNIPGSQGTYTALRKPDGHLLLANGYDADILEVDSNFKTLSHDRRQGFAAGGCAGL